MTLAAGESAALTVRGVTEARMAATVTANAVKACAIRFKATPSVVSGLCGPVARED
jgi:hypothetical protein